MLSRWLELPVVGDRHAIVDSANIVGVEGPDHDKMGTANSPVIVHLRGGHRLEVIGISPTMLLNWMVLVAKREIRVTFYDKFWDELNAGMAFLEADQRLGKHG